MRSGRSTNSFLYQQLATKHDQSRTPEPIETTDLITSSTIYDVGMATATDKYKHQTNYAISNRFNASTLGFLLDKPWENLFSNSFTKLSAVIEDAYNEKKYLRNSGASVCATFLFGNELHIANIGKNTIYLVTVTPDSSSITLLNKKIMHRPTAANEFERLRKFADNDTFKRDFNLVLPQHFVGTAKKLNGKLAGSASVSRALGFSNYEIDGLIHTPEFLHATICPPKNGCQFIISASASLFSGVSHPEDKIKRIVVKHKDHTLDVMAKAISEELQGSSTTRRSNAVCVMPAIASDTLPEHITYTAIISGHHNNMVADIINNHFHAIFDEQLKKICISHTQPSEPAPAIDDSTLATLPIVSPLRI